LDFAATGAISFLCNKPSARNSDPDNPAPALSPSQYFEVTSASGSLIKIKNLNHRKGRTPAQEIHSITLVI
jgi:hypothetical protein